MSKNAVLQKQFKMIKFKAQSKSESEGPSSSKKKKKQENLLVNVDAIEQSTEVRICDERNRKVITCEAIFKEVAVVDNEVSPIEPEQLVKAQPWKQRHYLKPNRLQIQLEIAMLKPVKYDKAERMMQMMGWKGGALGKSGRGIKEPIVPNLAYALNTKGFGRYLPPPPPPPPPPKMNKNLVRQRQVKKTKDNFKVNVLRSILDFVRDEMEVELLFDCKLNNKQRKDVHRMVGAIIGAEDQTDVIFEFEGFTQLDLVLNICKYNRYVLTTQSEGEHPNRYLCLYKDAPPFMFLVTHLDLRDIKVVRKKFVPPQPGQRKKGAGKKKKPFFDEKVRAAFRASRKRGRKPTEPDKGTSVALADDRASINDITSTDKTSNNDNKEVGNINDESSQINDKIDGDGMEITNETPNVVDELNSPPKDIKDSVTMYQNAENISNVALNILNITENSKETLKTSNTVTELNITPNDPKNSVTMSQNAEKISDIAINVKNKTEIPMEITNETSNVVHQLNSSSYDIKDFVTKSEDAENISTVDLNFQIKTDISNEVKLESCEGVDESNKYYSKISENKPNTSKYSDGTTDKDDETTIEILENTKIKDNIINSSNLPDSSKIHRDPEENAQNLVIKEKIPIEFTKTSKETSEIDAIESNKKQNDFKMEIDCKLSNVEKSDDKDICDGITDLTELDTEYASDDCITLSDDEESYENDNYDLTIIRQSALRDKINSFFSEFTKSDKFTEFKFLGNFDSDEFIMVNEFVKNIWLHLNGEEIYDDDLSKVMEETELRFSLKEDCNGGTVIIKENSEGQAPQLQSEDDVFVIV